MKFHRRVLALFRKEKFDAEMAEEMRVHLEMLAEKNRSAGLAADEAQHAARRTFGGVEQIKERCREQRGWLWLEQGWQDLRYGWRTLRQSPGFAAVAIFTLALGIGVNSTTFSALNDLIVQPYFRDRQENLVALHTVRSGGDHSYRRFNYTEFGTLRDATEIFGEVAAMQFATCLLGEPEDLHRRIVCLVSENYFSLLGVRPARGRFFTADETKASATAPVMVASHELWQRLGGDENFVGRTVRIDGRNYTVIGVAPAGFGGLHWSHGPDGWLPLGQAAALTGFWGGTAPAGGLGDPRWQVLQLLGSLRPGLTLEGARQLLAPVSARLNAQAGVGAAELRELTITRPSRFNLDLTWPADESGFAIYAVAAAGMTITVLLIACLNVANMLFGRGLTRQREISIRLCLGASRGRVVRQLLIEGLLLAGAGGLAGLGVSRWTNQLLLELTSRRTGAMTLHLRTTFDWPLLGGTFLLCLLATLVIGLAPALQATKRNLVDDLKRQGGEPTTATRWNRFLSLRHCLAMAQLALSLLLLFGAGLLVRSVVNAERDRGFETEGQIVANLDYYLANTPRDAVAVRQRELLERAARLPGVVSVALASAVPYNFEANNRPVFPVGRGAGESGGEAGQFTSSSVVSHRYFETMKIPLLRGRDFTAAEALEPGGRRVAIIDESLAHSLFGDGEPLGRHLALSKADADGQHGEKEYEIVGIVRSPREDAFQSERPFRRFYRPLGQNRMSMLNTYLHVRFAPSVALPPMVDRLRQELRALDPQTPLLACEPLEAFIGKNLNVWTVRLLAVLFSFFGLVAVLLAVVGVYGVKSYSVTRRTHEIGIRVAIGASSGDILALLLRQSVLQAAVGIGAGLVLALLAGQFLSKLLYRVSATDAPVLLGAIGLLASVSILACLIPAWRATRIDPNEALRAE